MFVGDSQGNNVQVGNTTSGYTNIDWKYRPWLYQVPYRYPGTCPQCNRCPTCGRSGYGGGYWFSCNTDRVKCDGGTSLTHTADSKPGHNTITLEHNPPASNTLNA